MLFALFACALVSTGYSDAYPPNCGFTYEVPACEVAAFDPFDVEYELLRGEGVIDGYPAPAVAPASAAIPSFVGPVLTAEARSALAHADDAQG